jgi:outer membrane receptor protein involved in Fe transport
VDGQIISGYQVYQKENSEKAKLKGIEAELNWQVVNSLNIYGGVSFAHGDNLTKNEPLRRVPPLNGRVMSTYRMSNFFACAELLFSCKQDRLAQGDKDDNRIPKGGTPGWKVLNMYAGYKLSKLRFNFGIQNFFNKDYRTHGSGINGVGRSIFLSTAINF